MPVTHEQLCTLLQQAMEMHHQGVKVSVALQVYVSAYEDKDNAINVKVTMHENAG